MKLFVLAYTSFLVMQTRQVLLDVVLPCLSYFLTAVYHQPTYPVAVLGLEPDQVGTLHSD